MVRPCAWCKKDHKRCPENCIFRPHFPSSDPRYDIIHEVYSTSYARKRLEEVRDDEREDTAKSMWFEADARLKDPVHGCYGKVKRLEDDVKRLEDQVKLLEDEVKLLTRMGEAHKGEARENKHEAAGVTFDLNQVPDGFSLL